MGIVTKMDMKHYLAGRKHPTKDASESIEDLRDSLMILTGSLIAVNSTVSLDEAKCTADHGLKAVWGDTFEKISKEI